MRRAIWLLILGGLLLLNAPVRAQECDGEESGVLCTDTDGDPCTVAQCNGNGTCDQAFAQAENGTTCDDTDPVGSPDRACTIPGCLFGECEQIFANADASVPCPDTDNDPCTIAGCDGSGSCGQRSNFAPEGTACGDTDGNVCTIASCDRFADCSQTGTPAAEGAPCPDTDDNVCTIPGCDDEGECDQEAGTAMEGTSCPDTDGSPDTVAMCDGHGNCDQGGVIGPTAPTQPAPVMSVTMIAAMICLLVGLGLRQVRRRRS